MTLYNISNLAGLFHHLDACTCDVLLETADGRLYKWSSQREVLRSLAETMGASPIPQLALHCLSRTDLDRMMDYLMECRRSSAAA